MTPEFWRDRNILITGHTGFKGGWLALWLKMLGAKVIGYALPPATTPNLFELARVGAQVQSVFADIRQLPKLKRVMDDAQPQIVFHLAAQSLVRESYQSPIETLETNVMGTANVLEASRNAKSVRALVVVTSDKCYENRNQQAGYRETDPLGGHDPYSSSKAAAELVTSSYRRSYFHIAGCPAVATARAGNVIGGGDFAPDRILPDCVRAAEHDRPISIRFPAATRPWQFVLEPLAGYLTLAERLVQEGQAFAEAWNFGPLEGANHTVRWLCEQFAVALAERTGVQLAIQEAAQVSDRHEAKFLHLDVSKAQDRLHWRPILGLNATLAMTASWYAEFLTGGRVSELTHSQIEQFQTLLTCSDA